MCQYVVHISFVISGESDYNAKFCGGFDHAGWPGFIIFIGYFLPSDVELKMY